MIEDKKFNNINFSEAQHDAVGYENCTFLNCNFEDVNLSLIKIIDCVFKDCNLSLVKLGKTVLRDVQFTGCKMLGLHFEHCHEYGLSFTVDNCLLNHSSFYQRRLKKTIIKNSNLLDCDFTETDLSESILQHNDFKGAIFDETILEKADLSGSFNYSINPQKNKIKKAIFSLQSIGGLLDQYDIKIKPI